jgi:hypothetical protein
VNGIHQREHRSRALDLLEPCLQPTLLLLDGKEGLLDRVGRVLAASLSTTGSAIRGGQT